MGTWEPSELCVCVEEYTFNNKCRFCVSVAWLCVNVTLLFQCCCSFAAVHIMSSHLLLSHSVPLFFSPLISLLFFFLVPAACKLS